MIKKLDKRLLEAILTYLGFIFSSFRPAEHATAVHRQLTESRLLFYLRDEMEEPGLHMDDAVVEYFVSFIPSPVDVQDLIYAEESKEEKYFREAAINEFWRMIVRSLGWVNGEDNLLMINSFFYVMQWICERRVVREYQTEDVKDVLKEIHDKSDLHSCSSGQSLKESGKHISKTATTAMRRSWCRTGSLHCILSSIPPFL